MSDKTKNFRRRTIGNHVLKPETQMMGYGFDPSLSEGSLKPPVFLTSTFVFESAEHGRDFFDVVSGRREARPDEVSGLIYSRFNNPDMEVLEDRLSLWEDAEMAIVYSSGMAAIYSAIMAHLQPGEVLIYSQPIYGGTETLLLNLLPKWGIKPLVSLPMTATRPWMTPLPKPKSWAPSAWFWLKRRPIPPMGWWISIIWPKR